MSPGRRPTATVLKLIRGDHHTERHRDDRPKINEPPELPPDVKLTDAEQRYWDYLLRTAYVPGVHGASDGAAFLRVVRLAARVNDCDAKIQQHGLLMRDPKTNRPSLLPYVKLSRDLSRQLGIALAEIGATPAGRVRIAGPRSKVPPGDAESWDQID